MELEMKGWAFLELLKDRELAVEHDLRDKLSSLVINAGSQTDLARDLGISAAYLGDILHGRRGISEKLAGKLGWRKVTVFVKP